jgi:Cu/Ag efflux protein CusF
MRRRAILFTPLFALACAKKAEKGRFDYGEPQKTYPMRGKVLRLRPADRVASIEHEKIEGWMDAMTMDFPVPGEQEFAKLKEGMTIRATVCTNDLFFWLIDIRPEP